MKKTVVIMFVALLHGDWGKHTPFLKVGLKSGIKVLSWASTSLRLPALHNRYLTGKLPQRTGNCGDMAGFRDECEIQFLAPIKSTCQSEKESGMYFGKKNDSSLQPLPICFGGKQHVFLVRIFCSDTKTAIPSGGRKCLTVHSSPWSFSR